MATSREKVVKVENLSPGVHFTDDSLLGTDTGSANINMKLANNQLSDTAANLNAGPVGAEESQVDEDEDSIREAADMLYPLPEGWPKISQLFVCRSWDFSTATSPSVNKAVSHLELLQNVIEDWSQEAVTDILSRVSSRLTKSRAASAVSGVQIIQAPGTAGSSRKQLRFTSAGPSERQLTAASSLSRPASSVSSTPQLSVQGVGAVADKDEEKPGSESPKPTPVEDQFDIPYLGAEEVLDEVITLLARLENDRLMTKDGLKNERERVKMLGDKIDKLAVQRMTELPEAVQTEHEACAMDINELNWHVSYRSRVESRIKNKVAIAEVLNSRLKEDINFVQQHCPLVQEKLDLEKEAMDRIKLAQTDTNEELGTTVERCAKVESKSEEANQKAANERAHIKRDLDTVHKDLNVINGELAEAKMTHNTYIHQCNDYRQQLKDNEHELKILEVKEENAKAAEAMQTTKVQDLQEKIVEQEFEHRRLEDSITGLERKLASQRNIQARAEKELTSSIENQEETLRQLTRSNQELDMDIEDHEIKIEGCDKQRVADEKNLRRMTKEMERTAEQTRATEDDLGKVRVINLAIRRKLQKEEGDCIHEEDSLKATAEALRKQVKEEIHSRTVIQARIHSDGNELVKSKVEMKQKKVKIEKKADEVDKTVQIILEKVEKLRKAHAERTKTIEGLNNDLAELRKQKKDLEEEIDRQKKDLQPHYDRLKADILAHEKKLDHMAWKTEMMNKNMEEMLAAHAMMTKSCNKTQKAVDELQAEFDDLTVQINTGLHIEDNLNVLLSQVTARIRDLDKNHRIQMEDRTEVYQKHEKDLEDNLKWNKEFASTYRRLQNEYIALKNDLLNKFDSRINMETALKDLKQVKSLQSRMHTALQQYYKYRGLYNKAELSRMRNESSDNAQKVAHLQTEMDTALEKISKFLHSQMDGSVAKKIAMDKVMREERGEIVRSDTALSMLATNRSSTTIAAQ